MTERELFEEWYFNKHYAGTTACWMKVFEKFENLKGSEKSYNGKYINDRVLLAYEAWQASASHEGYKLVPVEASETMVDAACEIIDSDEAWSLCEVYKAMIGAVE